MPGKRFFDVLFYNSEGTKKADPQKSRFLKFKRESQLFKVVLFMEQAYQRCILLQYCTMYMYSKRFVFLTLANSFPKLFFFFFFWIWQVLPNNKEKRRLFTCIMQRGKCCWPWFNECLRGCCCRGCPKRPPKLSQIYMNLFTALLHIRKENPYRVVLNVKWVSLIYFSRSIWLSQK